MLISKLACISFELKCKKITGGKEQVPGGAYTAAPLKSADDLGQLRISPTLSYQELFFRTSFPFNSLGFFHHFILCALWLIREIVFALQHQFTLICNIL